MPYPEVSAPELDVPAELLSVRFFAHQSVTLAICTVSVYGARMEVLPMLLTENWLCGHNLPESPALKGETLRYALIAYLTHPQQVPEEVVILLAEDIFRALVPSEIC